MNKYSRWWFFPASLLIYKLLVWTWNTLTNLADQQVVTEEHMDDIRENIEHLGSMKAWGNLLSGLSGSDEMAGVIGTYTGDGVATKAITGLGFQPKFLIVYNQGTTNLATSTGFKSSSDGLYSNTATYWMLDHIISLDANGFTVGDGTGDITSANRMNINGRVYTYIALGSG